MDESLLQPGCDADGNGIVDRIAQSIASKTMQMIGTSGQMLAIVSGNAIEPADLAHTVITRMLAVLMEANEHKSVQFALRTLATDEGGNVMETHIHYDFDQPDAEGE